MPPVFIDANDLLLRSFQLVGERLLKLIQGCR